MNEEAIQKWTTTRTITKTLDRKKWQGEEQERKCEVQENNDSISPTEKLQTAYALGDSIVNKLNNYLLTKKVRHNYLVKVWPFSGAKVNYMADHVKPTLRGDKPNHIILHTGTNDLRS